MNASSLLAYFAAGLAACLALAIPLRRRRSVAGWSFLIGMMLLAAESLISAISFRARTLEEAEHWQILWLQVKSLLPGVWLCFSLSYSRGNYREFLRRGRPLLAAAVLLPVSVAIFYRHKLIELIPAEATGEWLVRYSASGKILSAFLLVGSVLVLMNLERTFRSAVGTMQWRVKYVALGLGLVFGARIYTRSQALIYSGDTGARAAIETAGLLLGCIFIAVGYLRGGFGEIDIYPSRAALRASITALLAGAYLFIVGIFAQVVARSGAYGSFQLQALLILLGVAALAVLLLSKRLRQALEAFISHHFKRPQHDFRDVWSRFTQATGNKLDLPSLSGAAAKLISETFDALSVTVWLMDAREERLAFAASTGRSRAAARVDDAIPLIGAIGSTLQAIDQPFDLEKAKGEWATAVRTANESQFSQGGNRVAVPLRAGENLLGLMVLADRVNAVPYTIEEFDLLNCIGDQVAASLLNLRLTQDLFVAKEFEAFQSISAFFVHDLKNAASTLGLMLQNLPVHFDDPAFRKDALRGIARTADRINQIINSLSVVREKLAVNPVEFDLNQTLTEAVETLNAVPPLEVVCDLKPLPKVMADRQQLQSVITNLLLNARDAVAEKGTVTVRTARDDTWATLAVSDNGCGMAPAFLRDSLFRPFCTTKKKGLGIGMFQSKMIVEAHGGKIQVTSDVGKGTTFRIFLPLSPAAR